MKTSGFKVTKKAVKPYRREKRKAKAYSTYIYKLQKEGNSVSKCVAVPRGLSGETVQLLVTEAARLSKYNKRGTITRDEVHSAVKLLRPKNSGKEGA
ncbi:histone H2B type 1-A-like [Megalops cyprinoides]|uniref:histone H2B type 1-A-like n=1 Tax=Megalops cyprinoides TaxID=118141 RepID=UPI0018644AEB|nr:histone H2B type 1-A-like [Megalops cyprinoides]